MFAETGRPLSFTTSSSRSISIASSSSLQEDASLFHYVAALSVEEDAVFFTRDSVEELSLDESRVVDVVERAALAGRLSRRAKAVKMLLLASDTGVQIVDASSRSPLRRIALLHTRLVVALHTLQQIFVVIVECTPRKQPDVMADKAAVTSSEAAASVTLHVIRVSDEESARSLVHVVSSAFRNVTAKEPKRTPSTKRKNLASSSAKSPKHR